MKGNNLANKLTAHPKALLTLAVVIIFISWPRDTVTGGECPKFGTRYGIMMDAGSTGSRTHIFEFNVRQNGDMELVREVFEQLKPGLSSFKDSPGDAAKSLVPLMNSAVREVPATATKCTPLALKATAGLRLVGKEKSDAILRQVNHLFTTYPFTIGNDAAVVMDGRDEGPYAWLTVNFLLGSLNGNAKTAAILDMGGASTQIVFQPDQKGALDGSPQQNIYEVSLRGKHFKTYQHSHLGFGLKEAGKSIMRQGLGRDDFACFPHGHSATVDEKTVTNTDSPQSFASCKAHAEKIFHKDDPCPYKTCSFKGVYQPSLKRTFSGPLYVFSYFYDRMEDFLDEDGISSVGKFKEIGTAICEGKDPKYADHNKGTMCMDFVYLYSLLSDGYDLDDSQTVYIKKKIKGIETAWALGAMLVAME